MENNGAEIVDPDSCTIKVKFISCHLRVKGWVGVGVVLNSTLTNQIIKLVI